MSNQLLNFLLVNAAMNSTPPIMERPAGPLKGAYTYPAPKQHGRKVNRKRSKARR